MARLCQVKHELVRFNPRIKSDYISLEELLLELQLTPSHLEVPIPNFFREGINFLLLFNFDSFTQYVPHSVPFEINLLSFQTSRQKFTPT